jgi:hypothetical protein
MYKKRHLSRIDGNIFMEVSTSLIVYKRAFGIFYLCVLLLFINIIIKYVLNMVVVFCVVYTMSDLYKNRRKYMWIIRVVNGNVKFILYTIVGEDTVNNILFITSKKQTRKINRKN